MGFLTSRSRKRAQVKSRKDAATTRGRRVYADNRRVRKGKRLRIALGLLAATALFGAIGMLCFNPRFNVKSVAIEGNHAIQKDRILALMGVLRGRNIVLLPLESIRVGILKEPTIETAAVYRTLPDAVKIVVKERAPWAAVRTADGDCFTIDKNRIPFRKSAVSEQGLPVVTLGLDTAKAGIVLGKVLTAPGVAEIGVCLDWARTEPDFPLESVAIAPEGKLRLNKVGGAQALLGSPVDLEKKLAALHVLLQQQPQLRSSDWEYINLYAFDAPAVKFKPAALVAANGTSAVGDAVTQGTPPPARGPASGTELP